MKTDCTLHGLEVDCTRRPLATRCSVAGEQSSFTDSMSIFAQNSSQRRGLPQSIRCVTSGQRKTHPPEAMPCIRNHVDGSQCVRSQASCLPCATETPSHDVVSIASWAVHGTTCCMSWCCRAPAGQNRRAQRRQRRRACSASNLHHQHVAQSDRESSLRVPTLV